MFSGNVSLARRFLVSVAILTVFTLLAVYFEHFAKSAPILLLLSSSILCALYAGPYLGISAAILTAFIHEYFFQVPRYSISIETREDAFELVLFLVMTLIVSSVGSLVRSAQREAERQKKKAEEAVSSREALLAIVTHDLKNPLNAIQLNATLIQSHQGGRISPVTERALATIGRASEQMLRLIGNLLDYEKIRGGQFDVELKRQPLRPILEQLQELVIPLTDTKSQTLTWELPPWGFWALCDRDRLIQVFSNLISNASKFTAVGGSITVGYRVFTNQVEFFVKDNGPGIPAEQLPHVFDRYWQARHTARLGTGLGLSIVKGIVESHQGSIRVESRLGEGTTFFFTLALVDYPRVAEESA